ncbi:MAG: aminopeptidase P N-terminal domain-containing protein [Bacteroidetes bacterium]|nr:aminopeptidase P N-terminal domain-containing protein [Bacteroidota bacterium]
MRPALLLLALAATSAFAQPAIPTPPVRYDTDLLPASFHAGRRARLAEALPSDAAVVIFSNPARTRENDVEYPYRQNSSLYYLTGTHEPESALLVVPGGVNVDGQRVTEVLLASDRNAFTETWVGRRFGPERAQRELGVQRAVSNTRLGELLRRLRADGRRIYTEPLPQGVEPGGLANQLDTLRRYTTVPVVTGNGYVRQAVGMILAVSDANTFARAKRLASGRVQASDLTDPLLRDAVTAFLTAPDFDAWQRWRAEHLAGLADVAVVPQALARLRAIKTAEELALMRRAVNASVAGHVEMMRSTEPGMTENDVQAIGEYVFRRHGAEAVGYGSIVGAGENSTILHYVDNRRTLQNGDLVLVDMGAEYHGYTADVTRTFPANGRFTAEQKAIYDLVLAAQQAGIEACRPGQPFTAPGQAATRVIAEGLRRLGLIRTDEDVRNFFMHGTSHYLGLFVHDVGDYGALAPGMVLTVEPGIYIKPSPNVDPKWWNIGVRIEDDILVTSAAPENLSDAAPRTTEAIEALMRQRGVGNATFERR